MRFKNKTALLTGGASGIGLATARRLVSEGASVLLADLNPAQGTGPHMLFTPCDVSKSADVRAAVDFAVRTWGKIDLLINNAATMTFTPIVDLDESDWDRVLDVNLKGVYLCCKHAIPHMPPGGAIVNTSSVHAHQSEPGAAPYAASKAGLEAFTRVLALELAPRDIRVNCVAPGAVDTPMLWNNPGVKGGRDRVGGAIATPDEIAAAICFLASAEARFVNGTTLTADNARLDLRKP